MGRTNVRELPKIAERPIPYVLLLNWQNGELEPYIRSFQMGEVAILLGWSKSRGYHVSYSCKDRYPTWDEIATFRYLFLTEEKHPMVMLLPKMSEFVNVHEFTLHIWEMEFKGIAYEKPDDYADIRIDLRAQLLLHVKSMKKS